MRRSIRILPTTDWSAWKGAKLGPGSDPVGVTSRSTLPRAFRFRRLQDCLTTPLVVTRFSVDSEPPIRTQRGRTCLTARSSLPSFRESTEVFARARSLAHSILPGSAPFLSEVPFVDFIHCSCGYLTWCRGERGEKCCCDVRSINGQV